MKTRKEIQEEKKNAGSQQMKDNLNRLQDRVAELEKAADSKKLSEVQEDLANFRFVLQNLQAMGQKLNQANNQAQHVTNMYNTHSELIKKFLEKHELLDEYTKYVEDESRPPVELPAADPKEGEKEEATETV